MRCTIFSNSVFGIQCLWLSLSVTLVILPVMVRSAVGVLVVVVSVVVASAVTVSVVVVMSVVVVPVVVMSVVVMSVMSVVVVPVVVMSVVGMSVVSVVVVPVVVMSVVAMSVMPVVVVPVVVMSVVGMSLVSVVVVPVVVMSVVAMSVMPVVVVPVVVMSVVGMSVMSVSEVIGSVLVVVVDALSFAMDLVVGPMAVSLLWRAPAGYSMLAITQSGHEGCTQLTRSVHTHHSPGVQGVTYSKQSVLVIRRALEHRRRVPRHRWPVRFPAALIVDQLRAGSLQQIQYVVLALSGREGRGELFLAGLQVNERRVATQAPTSLFTAHCTLCEKCPLGIRSHETYRNYPATSQASLYLNTTHCKLIWRIPKSIHMKFTQINREITACPRSHPACQERERDREREREREREKERER